MSLEDHVQTLRGALDSLRRSVEQCGSLAFGDAVATARIMTDAEQLVDHELVAHRRVPGPIVAELTAMHQELDRLVLEWTTRCRCVSETGLEMEREGPLRRFLENRPRLFDSISRLGFFERELAGKFPTEVREFRTRWESRGVSDRLINRALKYVEDTVTGQASFVVPADVDGGLRDRIRAENFQKGVRPGGIGDQWIEGLQRAFA